MNPSIRRRLSFGVFMIILLACALGSTKGYFDARGEVNELMDAQLAQSARALLELSSHELYEQLAFNAGTDKKPSKDFKPQIHPYEQHVAFQIWSTDGELAVRSPSAPETPLVEVNNKFLDRIVGEESWRVFAIANETTGIQVQVGEHYEQRNALSNEVAARLLTPLFVSMPLIVIMIWIWIGRALQPLNKVAEEIRQRKPENLQPIETQGVPLEAKPMVDALNALLDRVHVAYDNIRLFTSNAAHELRTPLAALKVHSQLALRAEDDDERMSAMRRVERGVDRATALVEQLLTLTRLEPEAAASEKEDVHLHVLVEEVIAELAPLAIKKGIEVSLSDADCCVVSGNPSMLGMLIRNLVENAIRYTPEQGRVVVSLVAVNDTVRLRVADSGPGIPASEREKVFSRFYRGKEHHRENKENGTGLGLAIVERICALHHARIELQESAFHGLQIDVLFSINQQTSILAVEPDGSAPGSSQAMSELPSSERLA
jgi:two-component system sensor histidine kinase QseC